MKDADKKDLALLMTVGITGIVSIVVYAGILIPFLMGIALCVFFYIVWNFIYTICLEGKK